MVCVSVAPEVMIEWSSSMMGVSVTIETSMVWGRAKEDLVVFLSGSNCYNNSAGKECSHLIKSGF